MLLFGSKVVTATVENSMEVPLQGKIRAAI